MHFRHLWRSCYNRSQTLLYLRKRHPSAIVYTKKHRDPYYVYAEVHGASLLQHLRLGCGTVNGRQSQSPAGSSHLQHATWHDSMVPLVKWRNWVAYCTENVCQGHQNIAPDAWEVKPKVADGCSDSQDHSRKKELAVRLMMVIWTFYQCPSLPCPLLLELAGTGRLGIGQVVWRIVNPERAKAPQRFLRSVV